VVGAGPAGLTAAITAAKAGARVVVHERANRVGSRFHGDFQGLENWTTTTDALDAVGALGVSPEFLAAPIRSQDTYAPDGTCFAVRATDPLYYLVRRGPDADSLDSTLLRQALAAGVEVRFGSRVAVPRAGAIVAPGPRRGEVIAAGLLFETDLPDGAWIALGERVAPGGYAYLLVHGGRGTLSVCLFRAFAGVRECLGRARELFERRVGLVVRRPRTFGGAGNAALPASAREGGALLAGEAAGFQDPLWGFGLRHAMVSGHLAAQAWLAGDPALYDRLWRRELGGTIRASTVLRFFYSRLGDRGYKRLLAMLAGADDPRRWLRRRYRPSLWKRALFPFVRGRALPMAAGRPAAPAVTAP
jgi:flavin-dependent dehydrogenase